MPSNLRLPMRWLFAVVALVLISGAATAEEGDFSANCSDGVSATRSIYPAVKDARTFLSVENIKAYRATISKRAGKISITLTGADFETTLGGDGWKQVTLWDDSKQLSISVERPVPHPSISVYRLDISGRAGLLTTTIARFGQSQPDIAEVSAVKCDITY